jgi:hypothetical protein
LLFFSIAVLLDKSNTTGLSTVCEKNLSGNGMTNPAVSVFKRMDGF